MRKCGIRCRDRCKCISSLSGRKTNFLGKKKKKFHVQNVMSLHTNELTKQTQKLLQGSIALLKQWETHHKYDSLFRQSHTWPRFKHRSSRSSFSFVPIQKGAVVFIHEILLLDFILCFAWTSLSAQKQEEVLIICFCIHWWKESSFLLSPLNQSEYRWSNTDGCVFLINQSHARVCRNHCSLNSELFLVCQSWS